MTLFAPSLQRHVSMPRQNLSLTAALVSDVLQRGGDVNFLGAFCHPVENHVDEDIGTGAAHAVAEQRCDGRTKTWQGVCEVYLQWMIMGQERPRYDLFTFLRKRFLGHEASQVW